MSYAQAMEAAGAVVHEFQEFGSYQGEWYALVTFNGETGWVSGSYGSCSGCDAFEGEFGWDDRDDQEKLAAFGLPYLDGIYSQEKQEEALAQQVKDYSWGDYQEALDWVRTFR